MPRKNLLLIAFHFPPLQGGSGLNRTLSFVRYFPREEWRITVLTASRSAYRGVREENLALVPDDIKVIRAPALDTRRHLAIRGRYLPWMDFPDQFQSWIPSGCIAGALHCLTRKPDIILSTFPVASAHYIGSLLQKMTGAPWVIDFRDPMAQDDYPADIRRRQLLHRLERRWIEQAAQVLVTTPGTRRLYRDRYPNISDDRFSLVPNGYDEALFPETASTYQKDTSVPICLLHTGNLYRYERDPTSLFEALSALISEGMVTKDILQVVFRGAGNIEYFESLAKRLGVESIVSFREPIPYESAIKEMVAAEALLILQDSSCNDQIPAKIYEYLRSGRPVIALTDKRGDTARLLSSAGIEAVANLDDKAEIEKLLRALIARHHERFLPREDYVVSQFSRKQIATELSRQLQSVCIQ